VPNEAVVKIVIRQELLEMILVLLTNEIIYGFFFFFDDMLVYIEKITDKIKWIIFYFVFMFCL